MYEIWLVINTVYELILANMDITLGLLIPWLALMLLTQFKKQVPWSQVIKPTLVVAIVLWFVFFALVPGMTKSSFASVNSGIDWLVVAGLAAGFSGIIAIFVGPAYLLSKR
ncbi:MAG: hypothetical protein RBR82_13190 [Pseudomonas sp.]|nr:hypothetical protein [Pseudomonas sp.]